jgi:hypothetical protein
MHLPTVASTFDRNIDYTDKMRVMHICTISYDTYLNWPFFEYLVFLRYTLFHTREHKIKLNETEQNEQYLTRQAYMNSNVW